jgi:hypothetical protein
MFGEGEERSVLVAERGTEFRQGRKGYRIMMRGWAIAKGGRAPAGCWPVTEGDACRLPIAPGIASA